MTVTHPSVTPDQRERFYTPQQVCDRWPGMTIAGLSMLRFRGTGPRFIKLSPKKVVYAESALVEYEKAQERTSTAAAS